MLFDTDVLVWAFRGNEKAAKLIDASPERSVSVVTYMGLLQGARDKKEVKAIKSFLADLGFEMLPLTENVGHRAAIYMEQHALKTALCMGDALVAATAVEGGLTLCTANRKHYRPIEELELNIFRP